MLIKWRNVSDKYYQVRKMYARVNIYTYRINSNAAIAIYWIVMPIFFSALCFSAGIVIWITMVNRSSCQNDIGMSFCYLVWGWCAVFLSLQQKQPWGVSIKHIPMKFTKTIISRNHILRSVFTYFGSWQFYSDDIWINIRHFWSRRRISNANDYWLYWFGIRKLYTTVCINWDSLHTRHQNKRRTPVANITRTIVN